MGSSDWADLSNALTGGDVIQGVTMMLMGQSGIDGDFVYGLRSAAACTGFAGKVCNVTGFHPITTAKRMGVARARIRKHTSIAGYSAFVFFTNSLDAATAEAYMLGVSDGTAPNIMLRRGTLAGGLANDSSYLRKSTAPVQNAAWLDLKLEAVYNPQNDVVLNVLQNTGTIAVEQWTAVAGMAQYIDDALGYSYGSPPPTGQFYVGFGMTVSNVEGAVALFDYIQISKDDLA